MANLIPPRRGEFLTSDGQPTQRFISWIESITTDSNSTTEIVTEVVQDESDSSELSATVQQLKKRISDLENNNDTMVLNQKITALTRKVNKLISDLLAAVRDLAPNLEQETEKVVLAEQQLKELMLLNARIEEAFDTRIVEEDIE